MPSEYDRDTIDELETQLAYDPFKKGTRRFDPLTGRTTYWDGSVWKSSDTPGLNALDYVTDGSTGTAADPYPGSAIQAAIDDLPSTGGMVFVPEGLWQVDQTISITGDYVTLTSSGWTTQLRAKNNLNGTIIKCSGLFPIVSNFLIHGNKGAQTSGTGLHLSYDGAQYARIFNLFFSNCITGINIGGEDNFPTADENVHDCFFDLNDTAIVVGRQTATAPGVYGGYYFADIYTKRSTVYDVNIDRATWVQFIGGRMTGTPTGNASGFRIYYSTEIILSGLDIDGFGEHGVFIDGSASSSSIQILGNVITNNGGKTANTYSNIYCPISAFMTVDRVIIIGNNLRITDNEKYSIEVPSPVRANAWVISENILGTNDFGGLATDRIIRNNPGYLTENTVLSPTFAIDATGVKTVTIPHGLAITPAVEDCAIWVVEDTAVDDWGYDLLKVTATDATNVTVKINVSTASLTAGATAKIGLRVGNP
jgi:hypothetical protein